jgi:hypothetical protein
MSLQVHRRSEELRVSKAAGLPWERNARADAQRRSDVKAMSEPVLGREKSPVKSEAFYIVRETSDMTNAVTF